MFLACSCTHGHWPLSTDPSSIAQQLHIAGQCLHQRALTSTGANIFHQLLPQHLLGPLPHRQLMLPWSKSSMWRSAFRIAVQLGHVELFHGPG
jgi:hypothetical protein